MWLLSAGRPGAGGGGRVRGRGGDERLPWGRAWRPALGIAAADAARLDAQEAAVVVDVGDGELPELEPARAGLHDGARGPRRHGHLAISGSTKGGQREGSVFRERRHVPELREQQEVVDELQDAATDEWPAER